MAEENVTGIRLPYVAVYLGISIRNVIYCNTWDYYSGRFVVAYARIKGTLRILDYCM